MNEANVLQPFNHIHLLGIGGVGVSALVPELLRRGHKITGSDPASNELTARLEALGAVIRHRHQAKNVEGASLLVVSSAVKESNPEIAAARERGIPIWPRAKMLGVLLERWRSIVVTGAHGKTTTTSMFVHALTELGLDPTAFIGGSVPAFGGNVRLGNGEWAAAEGDESDGSFTHLHPDIAIVNNIDADHLDFYKNMEEIVEGFHLFLNGVKPDGWILRSADCPYSRALRAGKYKTATYGFAEDADVRGVDYVAGREGLQCGAIVKGRRAAELKLRLNGRSAAHNALAVIAAGEALGIPYGDLARSLETFEGVQRRLERKGEAKGIAVLDDYAHHPNEIRAAIEALRERYKGRLIGVFQPHLYSRTLSLLEEFGRAFAGLDLLVLTDIYPAREEPRPGVSGELLLAPVRRSGVQAVYIPRLEEIPAFLEDSCGAGDAVTTMGAGDVWKAGEHFLKILKAKEAAQP
ncbi:MAG: UDP-N-acetylmuramate--L-alanine ligase [Candidatus Omnitrophota bacterium]